MRMKRGVIFYILTSILLLVMIYFSIMSFTAPGDLISPPNVYGENVEITSAFKAFLGKDAKKVVLKAPSDGENRTAYIQEDLDGDGDHETIVFYSIAGSEDTVRFNVLDRVDDDWVSIYDDNGYGNSITEVSFDDLNKDGVKEILLNWSPFEGATNNILTIHTWNRNDPTHPIRTLVNQSCNFFGLADLDGDNKNEVLTVTSEAYSSAAYAALFKMKSESGFIQLGTEIPVDGKVSSFGEMNLVKVNGKTVALIDEYKGEEAMITELLYYDQNKKTLVAPYTHTDSVDNTYSLRYPAVLSFDIDKDGTVEVPLCVGDAAPAKDNGGETVMLKAIKWCNLVPSKGAYALKGKQFGFVDPENKLFLRIPEGSIKNILVYKNKQTNVITIYSTKDGVNAHQPLCSIVIKPVTEKLDKNFYTFSVKNKEIAIYGTPTSDGEAAGLTNKYLEKAIVFLA